MYNLRMEPIEVEATLGKDDELLPRRFVWRGSQLQVSDLGRRWNDEQGEHILVMVEPGKRVYELLHTDEQWQMVRSFTPKRSV